MNDKQLSKTFNVTGHVQGVFFRQSTEDIANRLGMHADATNNDDGSVTIVATGTKEQLDKLFQWLHVGPPIASVEKVTEI